MKWKSRHRHDDFWCEVRVVCLGVGYGGLELVFVEVFWEQVRWGICCDDW